MSRRVRLRRDGLLEIRRRSWGDRVGVRELCILSALFVAWGLVTVMLVESLLASPLVVVAFGALAIPSLCAVVATSRLRGTERIRRDPLPPPRRAA